MKALSESWQTSMACRWLKVPRPTSCPLRRTLKPEWECACANEKLNQEGGGGGGERERERAHLDKEGSQ